MADAKYNIAKSELWKGTFVVLTDTIKIALVTSAYVPNIDTHQFFSDITNEVVGTGYTAGGATLASKTVTKDDTNDKGVFDAADVVWTTATITARGAVLYKSTGTATTSTLIAYYDFTVDKSSSGGNFTVQIAATGLATIS